MKRIGFVILLGLMFMAAGCGGGSSHGESEINGNWTATLLNTDGSEAFSFTTSLNASNGNSNLNISNFSFTTSGTCFSAPLSESGSFTFTGDFQGNVTGTLAMTVTSQLEAGSSNVLTMQGAVNGSTISGTWSLTGVTGCTGNGTFTMNRG